MAILLKQIFQMIKLLNSATGTNQIAAGVAAGLILGFSPLLSLQVAAIFLLILMFRIQAGTAFVSAFFFKFIAFLLDPASNSLGVWILELPVLVPFWTELYHLPLVPLTRFNNSVVMGSGVLGFVLALPVFFLARSLVKTYRVQIVARFEQTAFWKAVRATGLYKWYLKWEEFHG